MCAVQKIKNVVHIDRVSTSKLDKEEKQCFLAQKSVTINHEEMESRSYSSDTQVKTKRNVKMRSCERKAAWQNYHVDDLVDVTFNDESFRKNLTFTNVKKKKNTKILNEGY